MNFLKKIRSETSLRNTPNSLTSPSTSEYQRKWRKKWKLKKKLPKNRNRKNLKTIWKSPTRIRLRKKNLRPKKSERLFTNKNKLMKTKLSG